MQSNEIFTVALNLQDPWFVNDVQFLPEAESMALHITIDFKKGAQFACAKGCGRTCKVHDTEHKTWRHLNFFQHRTYIHARVPRIKCDEHGVHLISVPWARDRSGFTLMFEGWCMALAKHVPVARIGVLVDENDTRVWRFIHHYVNEARRGEDFSNVTALGIDETSRKGHNYITIMADLEQGKVLSVVEGKDANTVVQLHQDFVEHQGDPDKVSVVTCDMGLGFLKGIRDNFPNSCAVIDKFHIIKHANEAVDKVRKEESRGNFLLKKTKYLWLSNEASLSEGQRERRDGLVTNKKMLKTARAYMMRLSLQEIYETCPTIENAEYELKRLYFWLTHSRLEPMKKFANTLKNHWQEILNYWVLPYTNAILEGLNSIIQNVKRQARGFRTMKYFATMIYLVAGKLNIEALCPSPFQSTHLK